METKIKLNVVDKTGKSVSDFVFTINEDVRDDIFKKAVISETSLFRQRKGADPLAGKKQVINVSKKRKGFRTTYGSGGSRTPKKSMWGRGTQHRFVGAFAGMTRGGRKAHAPKSEKILFKNLNNREWMKALKVGFVASLDSKLVEENGQHVPKTYPMVLDNSIEKISKTKEFMEILSKIGFSQEVERTQIKKIRAGKGTMRNRTYKVKRGPLVVVSSFEAPLLKAARNVLGFEVITTDVIMASDFGMDVVPGRAVLFTKEAFDIFTTEVLN